MNALLIMRDSKDDSGKSEFNMAQSSRINKSNGNSREKNDKSAHRMQIVKLKQNENLGARGPNSPFYLTLYIQNDPMF